jgi:hypothetical protein
MQLENYLAELRTSGGCLALISNRRQKISEGVLRDPQYRRPPSWPHFTWRDMYAWVRRLCEVRETPMRRYFSDYLESLGFAPPIAFSGEWRRLFEERTDEINRKIQVEFGDILFKAIESLFNENDFELTRVSHRGWQATPQTSGQHRYRHLVILPFPSQDFLTMIADGSCLNQY